MNGLVSKFQCSCSDWVLMPGASPFLSESPRARQLELPLLTVLAGQRELTAQQDPSLWGETGGIRAPPA
jgi:hypothetical protein